jgi:hypothetical protein
MPTGPLSNVLNTIAIGAKRSGEVQNYIEKGQVLMGNSNIFIGNSNTPRNVSNNCTAPSETLSNKYIGINNTAPITCLMLRDAYFRENWEVVLPL